MAPPLNAEGGGRCPPTISAEEVPKVRVGVVGMGAVGSKVVRFLAASDDVEAVVAVRRDPPHRRSASDLRLAKAKRATASDTSDPKVSVLGIGEAADLDVDVTVLTVPDLVGLFVQRSLETGSHLVTPVDEPGVLRRALRADATARERRCALALGTGMAPGLSCVLSRLLGGTSDGQGYQGGFDSVEEIHVASAGTGGPMCARRHHSALAAISVDWQEGAWKRRPGGSGRELVWFPDPVGGADCYRAYLADPMLLVGAFPSARRITARIEATRRDRLTSPMPMLRRPHPEGLIGAVRVEMRGFVGAEAVTRAIGSSGRPALIAAAVSAVTARWAAKGRLSRWGSAGLAEMIDDPVGFVRDLAELGVTISEFVGGDI